MREDWLAGEAAVGCGQEGGFWLLGKVEGAACVFLRPDLGCLQRRRARHAACRTTACPLKPQRHLAMMLDL